MLRSVGKNFPPGCIITRRPESRPFAHLCVESAKIPIFTYINGKLKTRFNNKIKRKAI